MSFQMSPPRSPSGQFAGPYLPSFPGSQTMVLPSSATFPVAQAPVVTTAAAAPSYFQPAHARPASYVPTQGQYVSMPPAAPTYAAAPALYSSHQPYSYGRGDPTPEQLLRSGTVVSERPISREELVHSGHVKEDPAEVIRGPGPSLGPNRMTADQFYRGGVRAPTTVAQTRHLADSYRPAASYAAPSGATQAKVISGGISGIDRSQGYTSSRGISPSRISRAPLSPSQGRPISGNLITTIG